jgi:polyferredoxin
MKTANALRTVKLIHTIIWAIFASCIFAIPVFAILGKYFLAALLGLIVLVEVLVLVFNRWSCPLTPIAARYTSDRRANFDIYLPEWVARYNKTIFGVAYLAGLLFTFARWARWL